MLCSNLEPQLKVQFKFTSKIILLVIWFECFFQKQINTVVSNFKTDLFSSINNLSCNSPRMNLQRIPLNRIFFWDRNLGTTDIDDENFRFRKTIRRFGDPQRVGRLVGTCRLPHDVDAFSVDRNSTRFVGVEGRRRRENQTIFFFVEFQEIWRQI